MDKNTGGAKPKTGTNNNNSNGRSGGASGSQSTGAQSRNRSPRRDNGYASRSSGGTGHRGLRSSNQTNDSNNHATRNSTSDSGFHRPSMPNSVARSRNGTSSQGRSNALPPLPLNEYSPLRGGRSNGRQASRQHGFGRPVLRQQNTSMRSVEPRGLSPLEGPSRNVPSASPSLHGLISSSEDSDSESGSSPMSPPSHQSSASLTVMSDPRGIGQRPMSMSPDAVVARELLQAEMDMMLQRDEEIARQLQEEIDHEDEDEMMSPLARPLSMFLPGGLQARGRHYPSIPGRLEGGLHRHGRDRRAAPPLRLIGPDRGGLEPLRFSRALRRHRLLGPSADSGPGPESGPMSPDQGGSPPGPEFDPDERVLAGDLDSPGDFLSVMMYWTGCFYLHGRPSPRRIHPDYEKTGKVHLQ